MTEVPRWFISLLRCPRTQQTIEVNDGKLVAPDGSEIGRIENGIVRIPLPSADESISYYRSIGGTHFHERSGVLYSMSSLDTPVYHEYLQDIAPKSLDDVVVDVGGGDGRNTRPWLERGYRRIILIDPVFDALRRFRERLAQKKPEWLSSIAFLEADARRLPLTTGCASAVFAIESLYYLNEDYELGLAESIRLLADDGKLLVSERDFEAGLVMRLLYHGIAGMLESAGTRTLYDGLPGDALVRTRCFTQDELTALLRAHGLRILSARGTPLLALLLGWLRAREALGKDAESRLGDVRSLLSELGHTGRFSRCHVVVADKT